MIHLALFLVASLVVLGFVGATFSVISTGFEMGAGWGLLALAGAGVFWTVVLALML